MTSVLTPIQFDAPLINPSPGGLFAVTLWSDTAAGDPPRWLAEGVQIRPHNYGGGEAFGVWVAPWNAQAADLTEDDVKIGTRPGIPDPFIAMTIWAEDHCNLALMADSRDDVRTRAAHNLRMNEQQAVESQFAARLLDDAGAPTSADSLVAAVGVLEDAFAATNTLGCIHARPGWAAVAAQAQLLVGSGATLKTPLGHTWVFGGGYVEGLGDTLVATSQTFGWRTEAIVREATKPEANRFYAHAERSLVLGYEALIGAAEITTG